MAASARDCSASSLSRRITAANRRSSAAPSNSGSIPCRPTSAAISSAAGTGPPAAAAAQAGTAADVARPSRREALTRLGTMAGVLGAAAVGARVAEDTGGAAARSLIATLGLGE